LILSAEQHNEFERFQVQKLDRYPPLVALGLFPQLEQPVQEPEVVRQIGQGVEMGFPPRTGSRESDATSACSSSWPAFLSIWVLDPAFYRIIGRMGRKRSGLGGGLRQDRRLTTMGVKTI
jgi:hypothetical protein